MVTKSTDMEKAINMLKNPIFIDVKGSINEARSALRNGPNGLNGEKDRVFISAEPFKDTADVIRAYGPGSFGTLGGYVRSALANLGVGYGVDVTDFGEVVTVSVTYYNSRTGRSSGQNFVIVCHPTKAYKYAYTVYAHSARWRDCNDYNQAIGFIRSKASALAGQTSGAI